MDRCGGEVVANELNTTLTAGKTFDLPAVDLANPDFQIPDPAGNLATAITKLSDTDLTSGAVGGTGTFDKLMMSVSAHLKNEFEKGRITGEQYTKAYVAAIESTISNSVQFLLGRDQAFWQAVNAQMAAQIAQAQFVTARVNLETAKAQLQQTRYEALNGEATYALTKMKLATEDAQYCVLGAQKLHIDAQAAQTQAQTLMVASQRLNVEAETLHVAAQKLRTEAETGYITSQKTHMEAQTLHVGKQTLQTEAETLNITAQKGVIDTQKAGMLIDNSTKTYTLDSLMPQQLALLVEQVAGSVKDTAIKTYTLDNMLPVQKILNEEQIDLVKEQTETQRAHTMDTRTDGITAIVGSVGKQKDLYSQQITSYQRDSEVKVAKLFTDAWITMKTIDEGVLPPNGFTNVSLDTILSKLKTVNDLV